MPPDVDSLRAPGTQQQSHPQRYSPPPISPSHCSRAQQVRRSAERLQIALPPIIVAPEAVPPLRRGNWHRIPRTPYSPPIDVPVIPTPAQLIQQQEVQERRTAGQQARWQADRTRAQVAHQPLCADAPRHHLGALASVCESCHALHWEEEKGPSAPFDSVGDYMECCKYGAIDLTPFPAPTTFAADTPV